MSKGASWFTIRRYSTAALAALAAISGSATPPAAASEIMIYGDIGPSWWEETVTAKSFIEELEALKGQDLVVRISSVGGSVPDGLAIYNALKRHTGNVTCCVDAVAYSIASLIAMAGSQVEMAENALMMIHAPWMYADGNAVQLRATADMLDQYARAMATSYAAKTGKGVDAVLPWLTDGADHYFTAEQALAEGLIDVITGAAPAAQAAAFTGDAMARAMARYRTPAPLAARLPIVFAPAAAAATTQRTTMPTTQSAATPTNPAATDDTALAAARQAGAKDEADRRDDIRAAFEPIVARYPSHAEALAALQTQCESDPAVTAAAAGKLILAELAKGAQPAAGGASNVTTVEDEADKFRAAAAQSIMARASVRDRSGQYVRADESNPWRGRKLLDLAYASLHRQRVRTDGLDQMRVVALAFTQSGSDFPVLLETALYKTLQAAYATQTDTWSKFCAIGSVSDFRASNRYRVGSLSNLDSLTELGEFKNKTIPDGEKATITAGTKGNIINLSRQAIINDDLGVFNTLAAGLGRAAKRTIEADVYALLVANPTMLDSVALFHANHGNLAGSGSAPSANAFEAAMIAMASQKDVSGNDYLDLRPSIWLGPLGKAGDAGVVNGSPFDPDATSKLQRPNKSYRQFDTIVGTPRLSGTAWYAFADPSLAPALEVAFLDGNQEPFLENELGFTVDGTRWKVRLDYGVAAIDYRPAYKDPGA